MKYDEKNYNSYNLYKVDNKVNCSVCNKDTNFVDMWSNNEFCSEECREKYYSWLKRNKDRI